MSNYRVTITEKCQGKLAEIDSPENMRRALDHTIYQLERDPKQFYPALPLTTLWIAKLKPYIDEAMVIPALTLYFTINEDDREVKIIDVLQRGFKHMD